MNLKKAVDHGEHSGKTINCDGFWIHPLGFRINTEKLRRFAVPQGLVSRHVRRAAVVLN
jgi:hypothetical protein